MFKNKIKLLIASFVLISPQIVGASEYIACGNDRQIPKPIGDIFSVLMTIIRIIVPILLVIMGMISFVKVVMSGNADDDLKKAQKKLINNVIAAVVIFFIVSIVNFAVSLASGKNNSAMSCIRCLINSNGCEIVESNEKICPGLIGQGYDENCNLIDNPYKQEKEEDINKGNYKDNNSTYPRRSNNAMVQVALSQVGNVGGEPYWRWYGVSSRIEWCATFVSWVANQLGYIEANVVPKFASCTAGVKWFKEKNEWKEPGYVPSPGDIIFFDWEANNDVDHVGIVERVENGTIYTIEGNSGDACKQHSYSINSGSIFGFATPNY